MNMHFWTAQHLIPFYCKQQITDVITEVKTDITTESKLLMEKADYSRSLRNFCYI